MAKKVEMTRAELETRKEILAVEIKNTENVADKNKLLLEQEGIEARLAETADKRIERAEKEREIAIEVEAATGRRAETLKTEADLMAAKVQLEQDHLAVMIADAETSDSALKTQILKIDQLINKHEKLTDDSEEYTDQIRNAGNFAKGLGASIGLASKYQETFMGKMESTLKGISGNVEAQKEFVDQLKETFTVKNAIASVSAKVFQSTMLAAKAYDDATTSFNAATGAAGEYNNAIQAAGRGATAFGVTIRKGWNII